MKICSKCLVKQEDNVFEKHQCFSCRKKYKQDWAKKKKIERIWRESNNIFLEKQCNCCKLKKRDCDFDIVGSICKACKSEINKKKRLIVNLQDRACHVCGLNKPGIEFCKNQNTCKSCKTEYDKQYRAQKFLEKENRIKNGNSFIKKCVVCGLKADEKFFYSSENKCRFCCIKQTKNWQSKNKTKYLLQIKQYNKLKKLEDISFRLRRLMSVLICKALNTNNSSKRGQSCIKYLGYDILELKNHLEKQFAPWMNWENHGKYDLKTWDDNDQKTWTWQIDHIIPKCRFKYDSMEHPNFKKCWALENLRPYSAKQNILDGNRKWQHI